MPKKEKKDTKKSNEVVINLDNLGIPIAIIISGVLIAAVIFFASRNNAPVDTTTGTTGDDSEVVQQDPEEFPEASATLGDDDPILGDQDTAKVAIIEYSDYMCGFCQRHGLETFPSIKENYIDTGKILYVFKEFPLSSPGEPGFNLAEGASCIYSVAGLDSFIEYHKSAYFLNTTNEIISLAVDLGANEGRFSSCLNDSDRRDEVSADLEEGRGVGISGTPGFVVGVIKDDGTVEGQLIFGAYPYDTFVQAIESFL